MNRICLGAERQFKHDTDFEKAPRNLERVDQAIAMAAMFLAEHIDVRAHHRADRIRRHRAFPVALPLQRADVRPVAPRLARAGAWR